MYWLQTYPIQNLHKFSFQKFCVTYYKKKIDLDTTSLIKLWKLSMQHESFNLAPRSSQKFLLRFDDIGVVLRFRPL